MRDLSSLLHKKGGYALIAYFFLTMLFSHKLLHMVCFFIFVTTEVIVRMICIWLMVKKFLY